jgi:hypothetical protein
MKLRVAQAVGIMVVLLIGSAGGDRLPQADAPGDAEQDSSSVIRIGHFSDMAPGWAFSDGWQRVSMAAAYDTTEYKLIRSEQGVVLRAYSNTGTSGVGTRCRIDLKSHPILEWRWKVGDIVHKGKAGVKGRHDFPARIYVSFDYDGLSLYNRLKLTALRALGFEAVPRRSIVYAWANQVPQGSVVRSPYVEWLRQIAVRSGSTDVGTWVTERRNVRADYRRIFGEEPPPVDGVALMTNTGHTEEPLTAYYGDIMFRSAPSDSADQVIGAPLRLSAARDTTR